MFRCGRVRSSELCFIEGREIPSKGGGYVCLYGCPVKGGEFEVVRTARRGEEVRRQARSLSLYRHESFSRSKWDPVPKYEFDGR